MRAHLSNESYRALRNAAASVEQAQAALRLAESLVTRCGDRYNALKADHGFAPGATLTFDDSAFSVTDGDPARPR